MSEEDDSKNYFKAMFGEDYHKKKTNDAESDRERVKVALDRAHEIRQFEIRLYWHRSLFFWGFILTLFASLGLTLTADDQTVLIKLASIGIALLGLFTNCAWHYIEKGSKAWQANWELHIDCLEDDITGKLYKTRLWLDGEKDNFFSVSKITETVIIAFGIFWFFASVFVTFNAFAAEQQDDPSIQEDLSITEFFEAVSCCSVVISILVPLSIYIFAQYLARCGGRWRSAKNEKNCGTVKASQRERRFELKN